MSIYSCKFCNLQLLDNDKLTICSGNLIHQICRTVFENKINGRTFKCPKCKTTGKINHKTERCGMCIQSINFIDIPVEITCDLCKGFGYLASEAKPVTEIVDWKL